MRQPYSAVARDFDSGSLKVTESTSKSCLSALRAASSNLSR